MLIDIFLGSGNIFVKILTFLILFPALLFSLTCHEYAHGFAAYTQGDFYAKSMGRLSLNPFKHLDPLGTLCMLIFGFGWAKPVPIVPSNFKNGRKSMLLVSLAGVLTNFLLAVISIFFLDFFQYIIFPAVPWFSTETGAILFLAVHSFLSYFALLNIVLSVFNLVPIPPLDGYKVVKELFENGRNMRTFMSIERYANFILIAFLLLSSRTGIIGGIAQQVFNGVNSAVGLIFTAFR